MDRNRPKAKKEKQQIFLESFTSTESEGEQSSFLPDYTSTPVVYQPAARPGRTMPADKDQQILTLQKQAAQAAQELEDARRIIREKDDLSERLQGERERARELERLLDEEREARAQAEQRRAEALDEANRAEDGMTQSARLASEQRQQLQEQLDETRDRLNQTINEHEQKLMRTATQKVLDKYNNYPTFDGTGCVQTFIDQLSEMLEAKQMDESGRKLIFRGQLRGKAAKAPELKYENNANITFKGMCDALKHRFTKLKSYAWVTSEMRKLIRLPKEGIETFATRVEELADLAVMTTEQRQLKCRDAFVTGINHSKMQHYIEHKDEFKVSLRDALALARDYEHEFGSDISVDTGTSRLEVPVLAAAAVKPAQPQAAAAAPELPSSDVAALKTEMKTYVNKVDKFITEYYKDKEERIEQNKKKWERINAAREKKRAKGNGNGNGNNNNNNQRKNGDGDQSTSKKKNGGGQNQGNGQSTAQSS